MAITSSSHCDISADKQKKQLVEASFQVLLRSPGFDKLSEKYQTIFLVLL